MHHPSYVEPGGPPPRQLDSQKGEIPRQKRKRSRGSTTLPPAADPSNIRARRRFSVLSKLNQQRCTVDNLNSLWEVVVEALEGADPEDVRFALLYSVSHQRPKGIQLPPSPEERITPEQLTLEGVVGLDDSSPEASLFFHLLAIELCKKPHSAEPSVVQLNQYSSLERAAQNINHHSKQDIDNITLCPILAHDSATAGFLVLARNYEPYEDESYRDEFKMFAHILADSVAKSISRVLLLKQLQDVQLASEALSLRVEEAERSNFMFRHMAESATVGCAIFDPSGHPMWLNEAYLNLTGVPRDNFKPGVWQKAIVAEDLSEVERHWSMLASGEPIEPFTFRVKRRQDATAEPGSCESLDCRWLLSNAYVDFHENGACRSVMGWLTDISAQKWNEHLQAQLLKDALETRRQTERFIDMVSHEIRNPLSAIIQTADGVLTSMDHDNEDSIPHEVRDSILDAGKTIILCAQHQKRIVDDILMLSKLDSNLLVISPNQVRPRDLVQKAVKMFEAELWSAQIEFSISIDASYETLSVDTVLLDESRVMQILLNLITNAIKFTRNRTERCIRIRLAASQSRPSNEASDISYIAPRVSRPAHVPSTESESTEIYPIFTIEDTGPGLGKDDMKSLFQRFSQASPKTYSYGGFGLGLFICRELAELQGGQIGLSSVLGQGTIFKFYVQARRCKSNTLGIAASPKAKPLGTIHHSNLEALNRNKSVVTPNPSPVSPTRQKNGSAITDLNIPKLHILIVEDNKINQKVLVRQLSLLGHTVYTADHGLETLEFLASTTLNISPLRDKHAVEPLIPLSLILMDLEMPIMDGLTCICRIRQMEAEDMLKHVPVIAVTANARSGQIAGAMEAGMDAVITKPFRISELLPKMAAVV